MADERIDVVVTDKVDANVEKKLLGIGTAADRADKYITKLKSALASVNTTAVDKLASAMAKVDSAQARLISAQARLLNAQNASTAATDKAALAQQKLATETARTEAAQARAAAATSGAALAAQRLQAAASATTGASAGAANAQQQLASATAGAGTAAAGAGNQWRAYINTMTQANTQAAGAAGAAGTVAGGLNNTSTAHMNYQRAARQTTAVNANIIAQMQDIGVSLAGGQNPLLVMIQQGSQLSYIASTMQGGMRALLGTIAQMALAWAPVIAAVGAAYLAFRGFNSALNDHYPIDNFVKSLGLTHKELKKLGDTSITMGDTIKATFQVLGENILASMGFSTAQIKSFWADMTKKLLMWAVAAFLGIGAATVTLVKVIAATVVNIPKIFYNAGIGAANLFLMGIEKLVNGVAEGMNKIGGWINSLSEKAGLGRVVGEFDKVSLGVKGVTDGMVELSHVDVVGEFNKDLNNGLDTLRRIGSTADEIRRKRLRAKADEIKADRTPKHERETKPKVDHTAENRAHALDMVNMKLDDELKRMHLLKDERDVQQKMDAIEEQLAQKKIHLNEKEKAAIEAKVRAIVAYQYVQQEMDRIYEAAIGPQRTYQASLSAIKELLDQNAISAQRASQEQVLAARKLAEATDPIFGMKEAMTQAEGAVKLYGDAVQRNNYYEQIRQQYLKDGVILGQNSTKAIDDEVAALMRRNDALMQQQFIQNQLAGVLDPILQMDKEVAGKTAVYAELDRLRQGDLIKEDQYQRAKAALAVKYDTQKLEAASSFFGVLAQITAKGHGVVGAISKAAAIAEATIQGYLAVQKALASAPPPWNFVSAAAVAAMTGANVAKIISTPAGSFATGGQFMVQGKSGVDANNINMNVTRGERVTVETPAQQRANDARSEGGAAPDVHVKSVTLFDPRNMLDAINSSEGEKVIISVVERRASEISRILG